MALWVVPHLLGGQLVGGGAEDGACSLAQHKLVVGRTMVLWHCWPSLACLSEGGGDGADNSALALLTIPRSLAQRWCPRWGRGQCLLAGVTMSQRQGGRWCWLAGATTSWRQGGQWCLLAGRADGCACLLAQRRVCGRMDDDALVLLASPCSRMQRWRWRGGRRCLGIIGRPLLPGATVSPKPGGADNGTCPLVQRQVRGEADNSALALLAVTGLVLRQMVYLVSEFNGFNKFL